MKLGPHGMLLVDFVTAYVDGNMERFDFDILTASPVHTGLAVSLPAPTLLDAFPTIAAEPSCILVRSWVLRQSDPRSVQNRTGCPKHNEIKADRYVGRAVVSMKHDGYLPEVAQRILTSTLNI